MCMKMLKNLMKKYNELDIYDLHIVTIILCFLLFIIGLLFNKTIYPLIVMYIVVFFLSRYFPSKIIAFLISTLPFLLIGTIVLSFLSLSYFKLEILNILYIIIKIWLGICYFVLLYFYLKKKKIRFIKRFRKRVKYYSFKELRKRNYNRFKERNKDIVENFVKQNNINRSSDYYKVMEDNIDKKSKDDLEEFVWINYLRFYKNKSYFKIVFFDSLNMFYLVIHVIIVLLSFVR